eukprot:2143182-Rhodomonas_salina.2
MSGSPFAVCCSGLTCVLWRSGRGGRAVVENSVAVLAGQRLPDPGRCVWVGARSLQRTLHVRSVLLLMHAGS